jgi:hypothetical protein
VLPDTGMRTVFLESSISLFWYGKREDEDKYGARVEYMENHTLKIRKKSTCQRVN